jgi:KDO2-lipid IV(A) lauroyltransferase
LAAQALPIKSFLKPHYWPTWALFGLMRLLAWLPYAWAMSVGRILGKLMMITSRRRREIARINLALCFPELNDTERRHLLRKHFASLGMGAVETAICWWAPHDKLSSLAQLEGREHLETALKKGRGVILLSAHFTALEIGTTLLALNVPICAVYRTHRNPLLEAITQRARAGYARRAIPAGDMKAMLRALKDNLPVWFAPDQDFGRKHSIFVPFFGQPAASLTATARLAKLSGAPVVPFFSQRREDGSGYRLVLHPALENFPGDNIEADTLRINQIIEAEVRCYPEHYLWVHRRFKTRHDDSPRPYQAYRKRRRRRAV